MKLVNLIPLKEIDFRNQDQFDAYIKQHELRPDTKVTIAGKVTTAGQAAKNSEPVKGASVFGKNGGADVFSKPSTPSGEIPKNIMSKMDLRVGEGDNEFRYLSTKDGAYMYGIAKEDGDYYVTLGTEDGDIIKKFGKTKDAKKAADIFMKNLDMVKSKIKLDL